MDDGDSNGLDDDRGLATEFVSAIAHDHSQQRGICVTREVQVLDSICMLRKGAPLW